MLPLTLPYRPRVTSPLSITTNPPITATRITLPSEHDLAIALEQDGELDKLPAGTINVAKIIENSRPVVEALNEQLGAGMCSHDGADVGDVVVSGNGSAQMDTSQITGGTRTEVTAAPSAACLNEEESTTRPRVVDTITTSLPTESDIHAMDEPASFGTAGRPERMGGKGRRASRFERARAKARKLVRRCGVVVSLLGCHGEDRERLRKRACGRH
ncbi:hypothetical protein EKO04_001572 [Ascochyta lentis]|uniref:Uncharacterized protein n=1 Tax=Ascochyta lentis TaxID=205686 RepID=A0A8H7JAV3_9PLEO|nr:hypothetical protein EKO04_001572 [Ascochyta lentis]